MATDSLNRHRFPSTCGRYIYHIAIIDYLTEFNLGKKAESYLKVVVFNNREILVSAVNPLLYAERFMKFMSKEVIINEDLNMHRDKVLDADDHETFIHSLHIPDRYRT